MLTVGLTGGIGSGKSSFARLLAERGAVVVDADELGHKVLEPGGRPWQACVNQFGDEILASPSLKIDRSKLASIVFSDPEKLKALNAITHPAILEEIARVLDRHRDSRDVVVLDAALIIGTEFEKVVDVLVVVEAPEALRKDRLLRQRGMAVGDAEARMRSQLSPEELRQRADIVVENSGSLEELKAEAERVWQELIRRAA